MKPKQTIKVWNVMYNNGELEWESVTYVERHFITKDDAISYCFFKRQNESMIKMLDEHARYYAPFLTVNPDLSMKLMEKHVFEALYDIEDKCINQYQYGYNAMDYPYSLDEAYENLKSEFKPLLNLGYYVEEGIIEIY